MSPELSKALADWLTWAETGAPDGKPFDRSFGLCSEIKQHAGSAACLEMKEMLCKEFDDPEAPFGGLPEYWDRADNNTQHENPARLAWVRKVLAAEL